MLTDKDITRHISENKIIANTPGKQYICYKNIDSLITFVNIDPDYKNNTKDLPGIEQAYASMSEFMVTDSTPFAKEISIEYDDLEYVAMRVREELYSLIFNKDNTFILNKIPITLIN
jgi:hypothetical protein